MEGCRRTAGEDSGLQALPAWLPDETLYCWVARFSTLTGFATPEQVSRQLFGNPLAGLRHDFPGGLDWFARYTMGRLGSPEALIAKRTLLPYFLPLLEPERAADAVTRLRGAQINSLKYRIGLLTSRFRALLPLKACPVCLEQDRTRFGVAYWHRDHQWPGVWICLRHRERLLECDSKTQSVKRYSLLLPSMDRLRQGYLSVSDWPGEVTHRLIRLATFTQRYAHLPSGSHIPRSALLAAYRMALTRQDLCLQGGRLRVSRIAEHFYNHVSPLRVIPELVALPATVEQSYAQVNRLLRFPRSGTHPLRHLLLISWLFEDWEDFKNTLQEASETSGRVDPQVVVEEPARTRTDVAQRLKQMLECGYSVSGAARELGINVSTAQAALASIGIEVTKRPRVVNSMLRQRIIKALIRGASIDEIAASTGTSSPTVRRIIRTTPGLKARRRANQLSRRQLVSRSLWKKRLRERLELSIKQVRALEPATYAWLYRHDRVWLQETNAGRKRKRRCGGPRVPWGQRDQALSRAVREAVARLQTEEPGPRIRLWQLCRMIPAIEPSLATLDRLPLTRRAINEAIQTSPLDRKVSR